MPITLKPQNIILAFALGSGLCVLYFSFVHETYAVPTYANLRESYTSSPSTAPDLTEVRAILTSIPDGTESYAWTDIVDTKTPHNLITLGSAASYIKSDDKAIVNDKHGHHVQGETEGSSFNLAVLKLPHGSSWGFVGVARGPTKKKDFIKVAGNAAREQTLVAFGLNITSEGHLHIVTESHMLDFPMFPKEDCKAQGFWVGTYGPEDPRLFWTDGGTPALMYGLISSYPGSCRGLGFLPDLRRIFEPLKKAMAISEGVVRHDPTKDAPVSVSWEVRRSAENYWIEKNWEAFYPGATPSGELIPHLHYALTPNIAMAPAAVNLQNITYDIIPDPAGQVRYYDQFHPKWKDHFHQATPLYRVTFCERGCKPTIHNTVFLTLGHARGSTRYAKFLAIMKVTSPFELISIGPLFNINGLDDYKTINYVLALTPIQKSDLHPSVKQKPTPRDYLPGHFFIDDDVLFTLGHADEKMVSTIIPMRDLITRHRLIEESETLG